MSNSEEKIAVIYHGDCLDGFGAAWAAWKKFGSKADYYDVHHSDAPLRLKGKIVYFLDIIYKAPELKKLQRDNLRVTAIDHHVSQKADVETTEGFSYALDHSGAVLAWKYFHPGKPVPRLLKHIEDIDIWKFVLPKTREVIAYLELIPFDFKKWDKLIHDFENPKVRAQVIRDGAVLREHTNTLVDRVIEYNAEMVNFEGYKVYAVNVPLFTSEIGHKLYEEHPPFAIVWREYRGLIRVSLRGNGKVDLTKIAGKFGGGGHRGAAGFTSDADKGFPWKTLKKKV